MLNKFSMILFCLSFSAALVSCDEKKTDPCGNGVLDPLEMCDPGIAGQAELCTADCRYLSHCGNGLTEEAEECDDGNLVNGDGCSRECLVEKGCGNGVIDFTIVDGRLVIEQCDDDNVASGDGCSADCRLEGGAAVCGNGRIEWPEECDDGGTADGDGCSATCEVESGCGDGTLNPSLEQCDDGNRVNGDGCSAYCRIEFICGDGVCDTEAGEHCEFCAADCCPTCGDGVLDGEEGCDDGNNIHFDGCSAGCTDEDSVATCGNGIWEATEECDDSNVENGDGCSSVCLREFVVGDAVCESLKGETCRLSPSDCCPNCGNGTLDTGEECDGAALAGKTCADLCYDGGTLGCTAWCSFDYAACAGTGPVCGDGNAECSEQCDGTDFRGRTCASFGFSEGNLMCSGTCNYNISNCTGFLYYAASNFDDSPTLPLGWSMAGSWSIGTPGSGPSSANTPPRCISTSLTGEYTDGMTYAANYVRLPPIDLTSSFNPVMTFTSWLDAESCCDGARVEISLDGTTWNAATATEVSPAYQSVTNLRWTGLLTTWTPYTVQLANYVGSVVHIRLAFMSDSSVTNEGWYVDDILVTEQ